MSKHTTPPKLIPPNPNCIVKDGLLEEFSGLRRLSLSLRSLLRKLLNFQNFQNACVSSWKQAKAL
jgi:hypothetical protein